MLTPTVAAARKAVSLAAGRDACGAENEPLLRHVLDEIDYGLMLIGADGRVVLANRAARMHCAAGGVLCVVGDRLIATRTVDAAALATALADAARHRRTLLQLGADDDATTLAVVPIVDGAGRHHALLLLGRRQLCETLSVEMYARRHGLTAAEVHVLQALCDGRTPADIAARFGVTLATVRTQVASIRGKTGTGSIRDLVRQVAALPPIVSALRDALAA